MLLNCNRAVTIRTVLDIPLMLVNQDRVFTSFPIVVTIWMVVFQKDLWWLLLGLVFLIVATYFQYKSLQVVIIRTVFFLVNLRALFVFSIDDPKQNATSLLTPVSNIVFYALSSGTLGFALHGSSVNLFLIGGNSSTANQILSCKWLLKLPWRAKPRVPLERA